MNLTPEQLKAEREAFSAYIKACDDYCTEPDAATAFIFAWRRAAQAQRADVQGEAEPNMRHPKIQALIGSRARAQIELRLFENLIEDHEQEFYSIDMEYWGPTHDALKAKLETVASLTARVAELEALCKQAEEALHTAHDHIEMHRLDVSHIKDANLIRATLASLREKGGV